MPRLRGLEHGHELKGREMRSMSKPKEKSKCQGCGGWYDIDPWELCPYCAHEQGVEAQIEEEEAQLEEDWNGCDITVGHVPSDADW